MHAKRWILVGLAGALVLTALAGCQSASTSGAVESGKAAAVAFDPNPIVQAWSESTHSVPVVFAAGEAPCAGCHDGRAFAQDVSDPKQIKGRTPFGPWVVATDCLACHTGKGAALQKSGMVTIPTSKTPVTGGKGAVCMGCHNQFGKPDINDATHAYPHYGPMADVLMGTGGMTQSLSLMSAERHSTIPDTCVACHFSSGAEGHMFKPTTVKCKGCHQDFTSIKAFGAVGDYDGNGKIEPFVTEVDGLMSAVAGAVNKTANTDAFVALQGEIVFTSKGTTVTVVPTSAYQGAYNWELVDHDKSNGIHNPFYVVTLLQESYRAMIGSELPGAVKPKKGPASSGAAATTAP